MSQLSQLLGLKLWTSYGMAPDENNHIGLEFEVEGKKLHPWTSNFWNVKEDHSLRKGYEWVLIKPLPIQKSMEAIDEWFQYKTSYEMETPFSIRTSIHVHVNAKNFTFKQLYNIITAYWLVEDLLVKFSGPTREGNLFCLRVRDADFVVSKVCEGLYNGDFFSILNSDTYKYGALNLQAICKYGSFEFRMMRGHYNDPDFIKMWTRNLYEFVNNAAIFFIDPKDVLKKFRQNPQAFLYTLFNESFVKMLIAEHPNWLEMMKEHYHHSYALATTIPDWTCEDHSKLTNHLQAAKYITAKSGKNIMITGKKGYKQKPNSVLNWHEPEPEEDFFGDEPDYDEAPPEEEEF